MSIKLIAVDMDGTFLSDQKTYNRERFMAQYQQMKAQGIRFVVASGNQYYQLISVEGCVYYCRGTFADAPGSGNYCLRKK